MRNGRETSASVPFEHFVQALQSQLDRAQTAMALKARAGLPLTFAVKDLSLDLRAHLEYDGSVVRIRPAGPGDTDASTVHLALTTITRPMIEENTLQMSIDEDDAPLEEAAGESLSPDEIRKLEWAGVQTVAQLVKLREEAGEHAIERIASVPAMRLRAALQRAAEPMIRDVSPAVQPDDGGGTLLDVRGRNLLREGGTPQVRVGGLPARVIRAQRDQLLVRAPAHAQGEIEIETAPGIRATAAVPAGAP
jgi:hypothetical protein